MTVRRRVARGRSFLTTHRCGITHGVCRRDAGFHYQAEGAVPRLSHPFASLGFRRHRESQRNTGRQRNQLLATPRGMASASSLPRILSGEALLEMDAHSRLETDGVSSPNRRAYGSGSSLTGVPRRPSPLRERSSCTSEAASDAGSGWASDRGSVFSERVEKVAAVAAEAMVTRSHAYASA